MPEAPTLPPPVEKTKTIEFDRFVDKRIHQTRAAVQATDLMVGLAKLAAAALALLLAATIVEHWIVPGGFGQTERVALFSVGVLGALLYSARRLLPSLVRRVNPLYAAAEIERAAPEMKNSLVNLLQLRSSDAAPESVRQTLERQAAERLVASPETSADRAGLVRVGYVLLALVGLIGLYVVLSPKDLFATAARVAMPWADIAAPTRVRILDLQPGASTVSQGATIEVSARLTGLREEDEALLRYSTRDGRSIDRSLPLVLDESGLRYRALLPAEGGLGLQTSHRYRITAGDARTPVYEISVLAAPTIAPIQVEYDYPDYTGYANRVVDGVGDISAIEGTRVILTAEANLPIDSAQIDLDADGRPNHRMKPAETIASGRLTLRREANSGVAPRQSYYVLRFTSRDGQANTNPAKYRYEVTPDLPPEATILRPEEATFDIALGEEVEIVVEARDPDFALSSVRVRGEANRRRVLNESLIPQRSNDGFRGRFSAPLTVDPERLGLKVGDELIYWVEAADNRAPEPNRVVTSRKRIRVVGEQRREGANGEASASGEAQPGEGQPNQDDQGQNEQGQNQQGQNQQGQNQQGQPQDGSSADGTGGSEPGEGGQQQPPSEQQPNGEQAEQQQPGSDDSQQPNQEGTEGGQAKQQESGDENSGNGQQQDGVRGAGEASEDAEQGEAQDGAAGESNNANEGAGGGAANRPGASGQGERRPGEPTGGPDQPVARDGSDDGAAFDRIREHLAEQERSQGESESREPADSDRQRSTSENAAGDPNEGRPEMGNGRPDDADADLNQQDAAGESPDRAAEQRDPSASAEGRQRDAQSSEAGAEGQDSPSADTRESNDPREGTGDSGQNQAADEGAGQSADRGAGERSGQAGQEQFADEPTGQSSGDQRGAGSESTSGGEQENGEQEGGDPSTGEQQRGEPSQDGSQDASPGAESGDSSSSGQSGESAGESTGDGATGENRSEGESNHSERPDAGENPNSPPGPGEASPRGGQRDGQSDGPERDSAEPGGDEANLDYARRQTDLVLERLSEQLEREGPDKDLLDKLGWSEDDLRRFVSRWRERQQRAARGGDAAEAELDDALRSLGLGQSGPRSTGAFDRDELRDLRERARTTIPPAIRDRLKTYNRGVSAAEQEAGE